MEARTRSTRDISQENEREFRPHVRHVHVHAKCDSDWRSCLRWIPEPRYSDAPFPEIKYIKFPSEAKLMRSFPHATVQSEWTFYPNFGQTVTYHVGKRCFIDKNHHRGKGVNSEKTLEVTMGRKRHVQLRGHSATDRQPFLIPEYSPNFHKLGSTLPKSSFGYPAIIKSDTFIPLQPPSEELCVPYAKKKKILEQEEEINEVKTLNRWRPAVETRWRL